MTDRLAAQRTALIVEDEPLARRRLAALLGEVPWLRCTGEAMDGLTAVRLIDELAPDVVFLDIQLPELDGISALARMTHRPAVIFTTAYDRYAVSAFELSAVDYLLKPFGRERFFTAVERLRQRLEATNIEGQALDEPDAPHQRARDALARAAEPLTRLLVRDRGRITPVDVSLIERLEAADDYTAVIVGGRRHLVDLQIREFERRLDPEMFVRIHRSHIVNLGHVREIRTLEGGRLEVEMVGGARICASRARSRVLRKRVY